MGVPVFFLLSPATSLARLFFQYQVNTTDSELKKPATTVNNDPILGNGFLPAVWLPSLMMENHAAILDTFTLNATVKYLLPYLRCLYQYRIFPDTPNFTDSPSTIFQNSWRPCGTSKISN